MGKLSLKSNHLAILGFSLIDCLVGIALTTIVISISFPSVKHNQSSLLVKKEARLLQQHLENLNLSAQIQGVDLYLKIQTDSYKAFSDTDQVLSTRRIPAGLSMVIQGQLNQIAFYKSGIVTPATIVLSKSSFQCKLLVSLRGRVSTIC